MTWIVMEYKTPLAISGKRDEKKQNEPKIRYLLLWYKLENSYS